MACHASAVSSPRTLGPALSIVLRAAGFNSRAGLVRLMSRRLEASVWQLARCGTTSREPIRGEGGCGAIVQWNPYIRYCIRKHGTPRGDPTQISAITLTAAFENGDMNMIICIIRKYQTSILCGGIRTRHREKHTKREDKGINSRISRCAPKGCD